MLLALETSTDRCGVALAAPNGVLVELTIARPRAHAANLVPLIRDALRYGDTALPDVAAIAVSAGPGSYTGLRIGVSTAKGLASATGARLVAVPSLMSIAAAAEPFAPIGALVLAALRARRGEVYLARYRMTPDGPDAVDDAAAVVLETLSGRLGPRPDAPLWIAGAGAAMLEPALREAGWTYDVVPAAAAVASAARVARLGWQRLEQGRVEDVAAFEPRYLKEFVAQKPKGSIFERLSF